MEHGAPDLRDLTAEEAALVADYPLPDGVPDAVVNKAMLEVALGVSQTTISAWLRRPNNPLPYETAGTNGRSYEFRLSAAYAWMRNMQARDARNRAEAEAASNQLALALLGGETAAPQDGRLSLSDQRKLLEVELLRTQAARGRGDLLWRDDVLAGLEDIFAALRDGLDALPDRLARELGLEGRDLETCERACDDVLAAAARKVEELAGQDDGKAV